MFIVMLVQCMWVPLPLYIVFLVYILLQRWSDHSQQHLHHHLSSFASSSHTMAFLSVTPSSRPSFDSFSAPEFLILMRLIRETGPYRGRGERLIGTTLQHQSTTEQEVVVVVVEGHWNSMNRFLIVQWSFEQTLVFSWTLLRCDSVAGLILLCLYTTTRDYDYMAYIAGFGFN